MINTKFIKLTIAAFLFTAIAACGQTAKDNKKQIKEDMRTIHLTTQEFKDKVYDYEADPTSFNYKGDMPAIVDFYATWCGPCRRLGPVLEELAKEYEGKIIIYKVDVDKNLELSQAFGIRSIPTLLYIPAKGQPTISAGAPSKAQLKEIINGLIE